MENTLRSKYPTKEVMRKALNNEKRIINIEDEFGNHIQRHEDVFGPMLVRHDIILFGEKGDNGLVLQSKEIARGFDTLRNLGYAVITAIILDLVARVMSLPR